MLAVARAALPCPGDAVVRCAKQPPQPRPSHRGRLLPPLAAQPFPLPVSLSSTPHPSRFPSPRGTKIPETETRQRCCGGMSSRALCPSLPGRASPTLTDADPGDDLVVCYTQCSPTPSILLLPLAMPLRLPSPTHGGSSYAPSPPSGNMLTRGARRSAPPQPITISPTKKRN